jgi:hypothetical protein
MRTALIVALALVAVPAGVFAVARSGASPYHGPPPPAIQVRNLLASIHLHPLTCTQHGALINCELRNGHTCSLDLHRGTGGCPDTARFQLVLLQGRLHGGATWYPSQ